MNEVAVVICNYNKKDFVLGCIESVFASSFEKFDLIVVDNASTDGSAEAIREKFADRLTLLVNEENTGGSGGFNRGMQYAMDKGVYKYIHLLDNDVVVDKDAIGELHGFMEEHSDVGVCGSLILQMQHPELIQEMGSMIVPEDFSVKLLYKNERYDSNLPEFVEADVATACSSMYRIDILKKAGLIDKDFFIYWDDIALSWEIRLSGSKVCAISSSKVWHYASWLSIANESLPTTYYAFRNKIRVFTKCLDDIQFNCFIDNLVERLFRMFAFHQSKSGSLLTFFHAFDDALNEVRGKAEPGKFISQKPFSDKLRNILRSKKKAVIIPYQDCPPLYLQRLIENIRKIVDLEIAVCEDSYVCENELIIETCAHILSLPELKQDRIYIDYYYNEIVDDADKDFMADIDKHRLFFHKTFYEFTKQKLTALRNKIRPKEWDLI